MLSVKTKMRNKDRLHRKLSKLVDGLDGQMQKDMEKGAEELADTVRSFAPVKTGEYKNSIKAKKVDQFTDRTSGDTYSNVNAWGLYANYIWRFLEFGTKKMLSRPHIFGPYRILRRRIKGRIHRGLRKKVKMITGEGKGKK